MISTFDNCLFIHIPKVAGQSIETVFLERAGFSWEKRDNLLLKHNTSPKLGPPRLAHLTADEYVTLGYLSANEFSNMFSFAFVRNPWDRLVSEYLYREYPFSFNDYLFKYFPKAEDDNYQLGADLHRHIIPQVNFLCNKQGELVVDFVGRFENLSQDFAKVTKMMTGESLSLPHKNKSTQNKLISLLTFSTNKKQHYSKFYDDKSREFVAKLYKRDIELFGYYFEKK